MAMFYALDNNNDYYKGTIVLSKGKAGWAPMCGCFILIPGEWAALFLDYPDLGTMFRWIVDLINLVDKTEQVKFKYLTQSVVCACFLASKVPKPVSTMASKWKRLIFLKQTHDWAKLVWSIQLQFAEAATGGTSLMTSVMPPVDDFASVFGGLLWMEVRVPRARTGYGQAPQRVHPAPTGLRVTHGETGAGPPGLNVKTLIRTLFEAQTMAQVALAMAQNSNLIAFHTATAQALGSKSGDKDSKLTVAKNAILQACCRQADSTTFAAPVVYLDMEGEGGTLEAIG
jgi:hypothetical protein